MNQNKRDLQIIDLAARKVPYNEIANDFNLAVGTIKNIVARGPMTIKPPGRSIEEQERQHIIDLYAAGDDLIAVSVKTGRGTATIRRIVAKAGITRTGLTPNRFHKVNENYFKRIDSEQKAYWLGFLMADGCIAKRSSGYRTLRINLGIKDKHHLDAFNTSIQSDYPVVFKESKSARSFGKQIIYLGITNKAFASHLLAIGWDNFKNYGKWIEIDENLLRHQLRGFMDGDGWVSKTRTSNPPVHIGFCSQFDSVLSRINQIVGINKPSHKVSSIRAVQYHGAACHGIYRLLYDDATIWLSRKRQRLEELLMSTRETVSGVCWCGKTAKTGCKSCQSCITAAVERNKIRKLRITNRSTV